MTRRTAVTDERRPRGGAGVPRHAAASRGEPHPEPVGVDAESPDAAAAEAEGRAASRVETVIVVHGLWMPGWETWLLRRRLEAAGFRTAAFVYASVATSLDENVDRLAGFAAALPGRLHFVGHSLGGVLILRLFERYRVPRAGRVVCLGSPLTGTHAGRQLGATHFGRIISGRCIGDLLANGGCSWRGTGELGIIAGDLPLGFGRLLGGLALPNDGTVSVEETKLAEATDHVTLHCTHMSMLWQSEVAAHVVRFLRCGRFAESARDARR